MNPEQLNEIRKQAGMSIDELANLSALPKSTVEKVLFGIVKHPRIDTMHAIERALGLDKPAETTADNELLALLNQMTEEEIIELTNYVDFIISKRK